MGPELLTALVLLAVSTVLALLAWVAKRAVARLDNYDTTLASLHTLVLDRTSNGDSPLSKQITREVGRLERRIERIEDRMNGLS